MDDKKIFLANPANEPLSTEFSANIAAIVNREDAIRNELTALKALAEQGEDCCPDWEYGETLIRDSYFEEYARELADDIGAIQPNTSWPYTCIDWEQAAKDLRMDYTALEFDGVTYWAR